MEMQIKEIEVEKIHPNPEQPRENFDKEKLRELAESILSNGLINPITVRAKGNGFEIVSGERRWKAHQISKIKKIQAIVKEYEDDGEVAIASLIENVHREDLEPLEKAKYLKKIMELKKISNNNQLAKEVKISSFIIEQLLSLLPMEKELKNVSMLTKDYSTLSDISKVQDKEARKKLFKDIETKGVAEIRQIARKLRDEKTSPEVKKALLNDEIDVDSAEKISKLKSIEQRAKAIQEHKQIKDIGKNIEKNISGIESRTKSQKESKEFKKKLLQAGNWVRSFRNSVGDSQKQLERTFKILMLATQFVGTMDNIQKEELETHLDRFLETLERGEQLASRIKDKI